MYATQVVLRLHEVNLDELALGIVRLILKHHLLSGSLFGITKQRLGGIINHSIPVKQFLLFFYQYILVFHKKILFLPRPLILF